MRLLVCGGRDWQGREHINEALNRVHAHRRITLIIHGGATGADTMAGEWAKDHDIPAMVFPADWKKHGRSAGPIRNHQMIEGGKPDGVLAMPGGKGTEGMVKMAADAGVRTWAPYG